MQRGSLNRHVDAPFQGKSVNQETYIDHHGKSRKDLVRPRDEVIFLTLYFQLFIPNLHMIASSVAQAEYGQKTVDRCKIKENKQKLIFD